MAVRFREATGFFGIPGRRRRKQTQPAHSQNVFRAREYKTFCHAS